MPPLGIEVCVYTPGSLGKTTTFLTGLHCLLKLSWEGPAGEEWWVREHIGLQLGSASVLKGNVPGYIPNTTEK